MSLHSPLVINVSHINKIVHGSSGSYPYNDANTSVSFGPIAYTKELMGLNCMWAIWLLGELSRLSPVRDPPATRLHVDWGGVGSTPHGGHSGSKTVIGRITFYIMRSANTTILWLEMCGELTGDQWIPRTNTQQRGKTAHWMTSSWFCPRQDKRTNALLQGTHRSIMMKYCLSVWFRTDAEGPPPHPQNSFVHAEFPPLNGVSILITRCILSQLNIAS